MGKALLSFLAKLAIERDCGRFEWWCIDWNEPSIKFYKQLGAIPMDEWTVYRVCDKALTDLASEFNLGIFKIKTKILVYYFYELNIILIF